MLNAGNMFNFYKSTGRFRRKIKLEILRLYCKNVEFTHKTISQPWKILFYGTDSLSEVTLKALNCNRYFSFRYS